MGVPYHLDHFRPSTAVRAMPAPIHIAWLAFVPVTPIASAHPEQKGRIHPMDPAVELVLADYDRRAADEMRLMQSDMAAFERRIDDFLIHIGPDTGRLLHLLATGAKARTILELGTSYGYWTNQTLWRGTVSGSGRAATWRQRTAIPPAAAARPTAPETRPLRRRDDRRPPARRRRGARAQRSR